jgi:hypothetical protein
MNKHLRKIKTHTTLSASAAYIYMMMIYDDDDDDDDDGSAYHCAVTHSSEGCAVARVPHNLMCHCMPCCLGAAITFTT